MRSAAQQSRAEREEERGKEGGEKEEERDGYAGAQWQPSGAGECPALNSFGTQKGNCFSPDVAFAQQAGYNVPTELMSPISRMIKN